MVCEQCGMKNADTARFCVKCGNKLQIPEQRVAGNQEQKTPKVMIIICLILSVLIIGMLVFFCLMFVKQHNVSNDFQSVVAEDETEKEALFESTEADVSTDTEEKKDTEDTKDDIKQNTSETAEKDSKEIAGDLKLLPANSVEGKLQDKIIQLNDGGYQEQYIDVYAENYSVAPRNTSNTWDNEVFYAMEVHEQSSQYFNKDLYSLEKKELIRKDTNNIIDYEVYMNPTSQVANKIVALEYLKDGIEVTEYYFDNNKKVNFIFQYQADNYVSSYATPDRVGQRFLYNGDVLTTYRIVNQGEIANYTVGANEANRLKGAWAADTIHIYSNLTSDQKTLFDTLEKKMLNAAYNTYNAVINAEGINRIQGYVYDENGQCIKDADIDIYGNDFQSFIYTTKTGNDGQYQIYVPYEEYNYNLRIKKDGLGDCEIYNVAISDEQVGAYQDAIYLFKNDAAHADVNMTLGDAFNYNASGTGMLALSNAQIKVRKGCNNREGEVIHTFQADANGFISLSMKPGVYTIEVQKEGYEVMYYNIICNPNGDNIYELYASPTLQEGEIAVVLTWGVEPQDLDSHLFTTKNGSTDHIWFGEKNDDFNNYLDVDDTDSYGPETVTIRTFNPNDYYKYCVVDYTNCSRGEYSNTAMSYSQATVNVYSSGGMIGTYHVPTNMQGVIWEVFEIRNGSLTPIQRYYNNVEDKSWWNADK